MTFAMCMIPKRCEQWDLSITAWAGDMSHPKEPEPVKLICSLFSAEEDLIHWVIGELEEFLGPVDWKSPPLFFDKSRFYEPEMGWPLHRRFVSF
ncbi:MAG TPA: DUF4416 family protein, partial [Desulfobacterales bacterium]|nr:DUF4416 family protein [Desulfobacterales bacterium]